jgi:nicotinate dehydrogenase subunit A
MGSGARGRRVAARAANQGFSRDEPNANGARVFQLCRGAGFAHNGWLGPHPFTTPQQAAKMMRIDLTINGRAVSVEAAEQATLLDVLRNELGLRATRFGCGLEQCGACMVLVDGEPVPSCARLFSTLAGKNVTTLEGLARDGALHPLQEAFLAEQAGQCGYCLAGILMSAKALLDRNPAPTRDEIARALDANLCRCGAHNRIIRAVKRAAAVMRGEP